MGTILRNFKGIFVVARVMILQVQNLLEDSGFPSSFFAGLKFVHKTRHPAGHSVGE
jgi:hypothetical protein